MAGQIENHRNSGQRKTETKYTAFQQIRRVISQVLAGEGGEEQDHSQLNELTALFSTR